MGVVEFHKETAHKALQVIRREADILSVSIEANIIEISKKHKSMCTPLYHHNLICVKIF